MNKSLFYIAFIAVLILAMSCTPDNEELEQAFVDESINLRITQVNTSTDEIVLTNYSNIPVNVASYWLCLGPGTYVQIGDITSISGTTNLDPNQSVTVTYDVNTGNGGLSLFATNTFASSDPNILLDYVQWGAGNQARADQAVTAGRWNDANSFVSQGSPYNFDGTPEQFGAIYWSEATTSRVVRVTEVNTSTDQIVLSNYGNVTLDVGSYWLCLGPGTYVQVSNATNGTTSINPGESVTLSYDINPASGGFSLFSTNTFGSSDPSILLDYVQWGAGNQARAGQAVTAGRWDNVNNFVPLATPYEFNGTATSVGASNWN